MAPSKLPTLFFISNNIQEFILHTEIIPAISSYSPILISLFKEKQNRTFIKNDKLLNDPQIEWEFFKY